MTSKKKPSIYYDRSTIGSSDELDEYGVWVKSEPQELSSSAKTPELSIPDMEELSDFDIDSDLSALDESREEFTEEDIEESSLDTSLDLDIPDWEDAEDSADSSDGEESVGEDFSLEEEPEADGTSFTNISMDDFLGDSAEELPEIPELEGGEDIEELDDAGNLDLDLSIDMDDGIDEENNLRDDIEFDDIAAVGQDLQSAKSAAVESSGNADLSTQLLLRIAEELSSIKKELSGLKTELAAHTTAEASGDKSGFFDGEEDEKIALTGDELDNILNTADFTEETGEDATDALEEENDFAAFDEDNLRELSLDNDTPDSEVSGLIVDKPDVLDDLDIGEDILKKNSEPELGESPDKEIAETAVFNETAFEELPSLTSDSETPEAETRSSGELSPDTPYDTISLDELDVSAGSESAESEFNLGADDSGESIISFEEGLDNLELEIEKKDSEDLKKLRENGAEPMSAAPDDISYLEEELDLSNAVIDEPELGEITDNPVIEPSLDNLNLELDIEEPLEEESAAEEALETFEEEIELPLESEPLEEPGSSAEDETGVPIGELDISAEDENAGLIDELELPAEDENAELIDELELQGEDESVGLIDELDISAEDENAGLIDELELSGEDENGGLQDIFDGEGFPPEEESFEAVLPEGFIVEADESQLSPVSADGAFEDDLESVELPSEDILGDELSSLEGDSFEAEPENKADGTLPEGSSGYGLSPGLKHELKTVLSYMDQLLESLPEEKIEEFARSEYYETYKKLFEDLGLV